MYRPILCLILMCPLLFASALGADTVQVRPKKDPVSESERRRLSEGSTGLERFGDIFYRRGQYDLARLEYEKALILTEDSRGADADRLRAKAGLTLMRLHRYRDSLLYLRGAPTFPLLYLKLFGSLKSGLIPHAMLAQGRILHEPDITPEQKEEANLLGGTVYLEGGHFGRAREHFDTLAKHANSASVRQNAAAVLEALTRFEAEGNKSPFLAALFSAILPGSGQLYSGHDADAFSAFFFNLAFLGSAGTLYNLERAADRPHAGSVVLGIIGLVFYISNITGALGAANRYNIHRERNFQQEIRDRFFNLDHAERQSSIRFDVKY